MIGTYYPTQSIRFSTTVEILGTLIDPPTVSLNVQDCTGAVTTYASPSLDSLGNYHQDVTLPSSAPIGPWHYWWTCVGALPNQAGVSPPRGFVVALP